MVTSLEADTLLLDAIYRGAVDNAAFAMALEKIGRRYRCNGTAMVVFDMQVDGAGLVLTTGAWDADTTLGYSRFAAADPAPAAFARLRQGTASPPGRMFDATFMRGDLFANEFFVPRGFRETMGATLFFDKSRFSLLGLHRGEDRGEFEDDEIADLERILPHLTRAFQLRRSFIGLQARNSVLEDAIERLQAGVVLLGPDGVVILANRAARRVFDRNDGFAPDRSKRLVLAGLDARKRLDALLADATSGGAGGTLAVNRTGRQQGYAVLVSPVPANLSVEGMGIGDRPACLLLVHDPDGRPADAAGTLKEALGLTPAAARLVAALVGDDDLKKHAAREGITIHTARFHLHAALARTGTRTQAELVRIAVRLLRDVGLGS